MATNKHIKPKFVMGSSAILESTKGMVAFYEPLSLVGAENDAWSKLSGFSANLEHYPAVMAALSKLYANSIMDFEKGLFCAWISVLVADRLGLSTSRQRSLYYAGLTQDVGTYMDDFRISEYLDRAQSGPVQDPDKICPIQQRRSHALVSYSLLEEAMPDDHLVSELVLHHHADEDGLGYPNNVGENQLSIEMQILVTANRLCESMFASTGFDSLFEYIPQLKLGSAMFFRKVNGAFYELLKTSLPNGLEVEPLNRERLEKQIDALNQFCQSALSFSAATIGYEHYKSIRLLRLKIAKIDLLMNESGLLQVEKHALYDDIAICLEALLGFLEPMDVLLKEGVKHLPPELKHSSAQIGALLKRSIQLLKKPKPFSLFV
jgi:hypothetical protein